MTNYTQYLKLSIMDNLVLYYLHKPKLRLVTVNVCTLLSPLAHSASNALFHKWISLQFAQPHQYINSFLVCL